ncbi:MAG: hypothetical protein ACLP1D_13295, partial [Xanthobacteraceae bacterium]
QRWRGLARQKAIIADGARTLNPTVAPPLAPARTLDPDRYKLLKKPIEAGAPGAGFSPHYPR